MENNGQPILAEWLAEEMKRRGLGQRELAEKAGLVHSSVGRALDPHSNVSFIVCSKLAYALGASPVTLFEMAGLVPRSHPATVQERDLLFVYRKLSAEKKKQAAAYISFMLNESS